MGIPSPIKIKKDGIEYISNVDRANYNIAQLTRAALRDVGKLVRKRVIQEIKKLPGMKRSKRPYKSTLYKVPYWKTGQNPKVQIGIKHGTWYGERQEFGTHRMKRKGFLTDTTRGLINDIRLIEGKYLKEVENENRAMGLINEAEYYPKENEE